MMWRDILRAIYRARRPTPPPPKLPDVPPATEMIAAINHIRRQHGVPSVTASAGANRAALLQSTWNAQRDALGHDGPVGAQWVDDRLRMFGVQFWASSEVVCQGWAPTPGFPAFDWPRCINAWLNSTVGHREVLLDPGWTHCGAACEQANNGRPYGTAVFFR